MHQRKALSCELSRHQVRLRELCSLALSAESEAEILTWSIVSTTACKVLRRGGTLMCGASSGLCSPSQGCHLLHARVEGLGSQKEGSAGCRDDLMGHANLQTRTPSQNRTKQLGLLEFIVRGPEGRSSSRFSELCWVTLTSKRKYLKTVTQPKSGIAYFLEKRITFASLQNMKYS